MKLFFITSFTLFTLFASAQCPDGNHPHAIDLDLPSGTQWSCCNIGSYSPYELGGYYAWGETTEKQNYSKSNYKWGHMDGFDVLVFTKYCTSSSLGWNGFKDDKTELEDSDDAAQTNWGSEWFIPTKEQLLELTSYCYSEWTTINGVEGRNFVAHNGNSVFFPAAEVKYSEPLYDDGLCGEYLSRSIEPDTPQGMRCLYFNSKSVSASFRGYRPIGCSVRPVKNK